MCEAPTDVEHFSFHGIFAAGLMSSLLERLNEAQESLPTDKQILKLPGNMLLLGKV